jgi:NAD-dependent DNA ligase
MTLIDFMHDTCANILEGTVDNIISKLISIKGIGESTAITILNEFKYFLPDLIYIRDNVKYQDSMGAKLTKVRFTGVRNKELVDYLNANGYDAGEGSVTKDTDILIVPYEGYKEGSKYKKAIQYGITIKPIDKFINELNIGG